MDIRMKALKTKDVDSYFIPHISTEDGINVDIMYEGTKGSDTESLLKVILTMCNGYDPREDNYGYLQVKMDRDMAIKIAKELINAIFWYV